MLVVAIGSSHLRDRAERLDDGALRQFDFKGVVLVALGGSQLGLRGGAEAVLVRRLSDEGLPGLGGPPRFVRAAAACWPIGLPARKTRSPAA